MKTTRKLQFADTFRLARIINSAGITAKDIAEMISESEKKKIEISAIQDKKERDAKLAKYQNAAGMELIGYIVERCPSAEASINSFLGSMAGIDAKKIAESPMPEIIELIQDIFAENGDIKDFFIAGLRSATVLPSTRS